MLRHLSRPGERRMHGRCGCHEARAFLATHLFGRTLGAPSEPGEDVAADQRRRGQLLRARTSGEPQVAPGPRLPDTGGGLESAVAAARPGREVESAWPRATGTVQ